ncbi:glutamate receptor 2.8-like [Durio zibethinus]|uniref:Glutamate receptor 2.8-like n=1 Tax=Durio zibethinus TaxID=66656 RepID=A0A6P5ZUQ5_DURZI|nr:glutamate receptor 2.8-like [Durio zibethinus]
MASMYIELKWKMNKSPYVYIISWQGCLINGLLIRLCSKRIYKTFVYMYRSRAEESSNMWWLKKSINFHLLIICLLMVFLLLDGVMVTQTLNNITTPVKLGVVLDLDSLVGKIGLSCINMALSDFYATHPHYKTRVVFTTKDSKEDVVSAAAAALDLIRNVQVQAIIGPRSSMQANFVINLGNKSQVPIVSFSATSPSLTSLQSSYFFLAAQSSSFQVKAISAIVQAFEWGEAVPIYIDNQFGESLIPYLTDALQGINIRVPYLSVIPASATDDQIAEELYKLMTMQTRVFIVHMTMPLGSQVLAKAKEIGMMSEGYVWIMTDSMTTWWRSIDASAVDSLQGVLGVRSYVPTSEKLESFEVRWKRKFQQDNPNATNAELNMLGLWAYDATFALAMAIEKAGTANLRFNKTNISSSGATDLETLGVSQNGPRLIQELSNTKFRGLSGDFHFVNGQLQPSVLQIVNVNGNGERRVGFWTTKNGLVRKLDLTNISTNSTSKPKLGPIIWPGDTTMVPRGWEIPTNGKKLRIGVPVKDGFTEFLEVVWDPISQKAISIKGYCIDVFDAVMAKMPYAVPYEYVPFATPEGKSAGSYNDLMDQVYYGNYDAVVGDTTIVANRSLFVDFTLPYTESGVSMVVPIRGNKKKNAWVFLKPLTWDLWVTSGCFFVFIGFVVWILEHRINEDFRGPPAHQVGTSFWFSFSTMVFAHRETVVSNLARFVVIIWCFVVLVLTQSYTASLTSLLTVEQLQPTVTDINELLKRRESVGLPDGSFVEGILLGLKFDKFQLKKYKSPEELYELFAKGSTNGGISAALDEVPYINLFLAKHCGKYTKLETTFRTDGFGFVFPKGSPLVADVSRAILNVTQRDKMEQIQNSWLKNEIVCPDFDPSVSSKSLGLESFWGLFLIAGSASISALIIFAAMFLYDQRHVLFQFHSETSMWKRIRIISGIFDQKDLSSHTFRKNELRDASSTCSVHSIGVVGSSPNTNCPPSPSSLSNRRDSLDFVFIVKRGSITMQNDVTPTSSTSSDIFPSPKRSFTELANYRHDP